MFAAITFFLTLTSAMAWANERWLKLPTAVGVTIMSAICSTLALIWHHHVTPLTPFVQWTSSWEFESLMMHGVLCFLLFASALHVDIHTLRKERVMILIFSTISVVLAASITGLLLYFLLHFLGYPWPLALCFLFGVIISPTDAVVAADALKRTPLPESLKAKIIGESLFNDGTAVVLFSLAVATAFNLSPTTFFEHTQWLPTLAQWPIYFIWQCIGGILIGTLVGALFLYAISTVNQPTVELLLTLAAATASYVLSEMLFASAPIAVVFAGLAIGYHGRKRAMSDETQSRIFPFWELLDELLNVSLFVLIGIQLVNLGDAPWLIAFGAIPIALISRHFSVAIPIFAARFFKTFPPRATTWMTWGGLRGGISLALAMSVPAFEGTPLLISLTYVVVVFSIVIQGGMIIPYLAKRERLNHDTSSN